MEHRPMRRLSFLFLGVALLAAVPTLNAYAQSRQQQEDDERRKQQDEEEKKKKQKEKDWALGEAPLPKVNTAGPCPFVRSLYDAARYVELKDRKESAGSVGFTGEIEGIKSTCEYKGGEPIKLKMATDFAFGRGPQADGETKIYRYWVAVTVRNSVVLDKKYFDVKVDFPKGADRVALVDRLEDIEIPRANATVSGSNFEVLVGFDVTPDMIQFNRLGKRFLPNIANPVATSN
jgi:hypothetical protein